MTRASVTYEKGTSEWIKCVDDVPTAMIPFDELHIVYRKEDKGENKGKFSLMAHGTHKAVLDKLGNRTILFKLSGMSLPVIVKVNSDAVEDDINHVLHNKFVEEDVLLRLS